MVIGDAFVAVNKFAIVCFDVLVDGLQRKYDYSDGNVFLVFIV